MADKTPLFWQRIERGGEWVLQLCPRGERIKLCGRAAGWHRELVGYVIVSIHPPVVPQICIAPVIPKEAPGLATGSSSGSPFSLGSKAASHFPQHPKSSWLQKKDNSKTYILWDYRFCLCFGISFPFPTITSRSSMFFLYTSLQWQWQSGGDDLGKGWKNRNVSSEYSETVKWQPALREVSVFPSVPCLRRFVSAQETPYLRRPTLCPQAMATSAWGEHAGNTGWLVSSGMSQAGLEASVHSDLKMWSKYVRIKPGQVKTYYTLKCNNLHAIETILNHGSKYFHF